VPEVSVESVAPMAPIASMVPIIPFETPDFIFEVLDLKSS